jgi:hypothetical protein
VLGLLLGGLLGAVSSSPLIPLVNGRGVAAETNNTFGAGSSTIMVPIAWVSDDSNVNETTDVLVDTGNEACAVVAMDCAITYTIEIAGADDADDLTPSTCATDIANTKRALSFCY